MTMRLAGYSHSHMVSSVSHLIQTQSLLYVKKELPSGDKRNTTTHDFCLNQAMSELPELLHFTLMSSRLLTIFKYIMLAEFVLISHQVWQTLMLSLTVH